MPDSESMNAQYQAARNKLQSARNMVRPGSDEDDEIAAAMAALDVANINRIQGNFSAGTASLQSVTGRLKSVRASIEANPIAGVVDDIDGALDSINALADMIDQLSAQA